MGFLDRLLGRAPAQQQHWQQHGPQDTVPTAPGRPGPSDPDQQAVERYRYLLRTAPPETIEQAHAEAFTRLTPEQRRQVLTELGSGLPASERARDDDPRSLARMATRAELRQPGFMERSLAGRPGMGMGGMGMGSMGMGSMGMGSILAGSLLASVAGTVIASSIASSFLDDEGQGGDSGDSGDTSADGGEGSDEGDASGVADDGSGGYDAGGYDGGGFGGGGGGGFDGGGFDGGGFDGGGYDGGGGF